MKHESSDDKKVDFSHRFKDPPTVTEAEWWDLQDPRPVSSLSEQEAQKSNAKPSSSLFDATLRKVARSWEDRKSLLKNPISESEIRSGDLEGLLRTRGDADELQVPPVKNSWFWPAVGISSVLIAAAAAIGIPIYLNSLEMQKLKRELAATPRPIRQNLIAPVFLEGEESDQIAEDNTTPENQERPPESQIGRENQERFLKLIERADDASFRGDIQAMQEIASEAINSASNHAEVLLYVAASLGTASASLSAESKATLRKILRPIYEKASQASVGFPHLLQRCGDFFASNGELERAKDLYDRAAELAPTNPSAVEKRAFLEFGNSGLDEAISALKNMAERQPENRTIQLNLARLFMANKQPQEALPYIEAARRNAPENREIFLKHLWTLTELGLWEAVLDEIGAAEESYRESVTVQFLTAQAKYKLGQRNEAIAMFQALAQMQPPGGAELPPGLFSFSYGVVAMADGNTELAIRLFEESIAQGPASRAAAYNNLAWLLIDKGQDFAKALNAAKIAVSLEPSNPAFSDTLARALLAVKDTAAAIDRSRTAIRLAGRNASGEMFETLGDALLVAGKKDEAAQAYEKALSLRHRNPEKVRLKKQNL